MINDILKWQAELSDQPKVYWTRWVSGSEPTGNFYQTKEAAQLEVAHSREKMVVMASPMHSLKLSQERWTR